jgi:hypothetical protein
MLGFMNIAFLVNIVIKCTSLLSLMYLGVTSNGHRHSVQCLAGHQNSLQLDFQCSEEKCH